MNTITCPNCHTENSGAAINCMQCGANLDGLERNEKIAPPERSTPTTAEMFESRTENQEIHTGMRKALQEQLIAAQRVKKGASWFYWIAGLSVVNSLITKFGGDVQFILGLGITQVVDAFVQIFVEEAPDMAVFFHGVGLALDLAIVVVFLVLGFFAHKGIRWIFVAGMALYALDGLVFLLVKDFLSMGFHLFALYGLYGGLRACIEQKKLKQIVSPA